MLHIRLQRSETDISHVLHGCYKHVTSVKSPLLLKQKRENKVIRRRTISLLTIHLTDKLLFRNIPIDLVPHSTTTADTRHLLYRSKSHLLKYGMKFDWLSAKIGWFMKQIILANKLHLLLKTYWEIRGSVKLERERLGVKSKLSLSLFLSLP